jgi:hypothetical protein
MYVHLTFLLLETSQNLQQHQRSINGQGDAKSR